MNARAVIGYRNHKDGDILVLRDSPMLTLRGFNGVNMAGWYAEHANVRQGFVAREYLERLAYRAHLPLMNFARRQRGRWQTRTDPLSASYLFVALDKQLQKTRPTALHAARLVSFDNRRF